LAERMKVWARSAGRCAVCGADLLEGTITRRQVFLGELAHIVGQQNTAGSPRGQVVAMSDVDRDKAENLMLVCAGEHQEIDRHGVLDVLTVEKLRKIKHDHEDWVRRVTGLDRNRRTVVLRMIGRIRGNEVELTKPTASDVVLRCDDRYPDFPLSFQQYGVEIDLRDLPGEGAGGEVYWSAGMAKIDEVIDGRLGEGVRGEHVSHLSVFAFARLPLLVYLGSRLDDTFEVAIYQRHRRGETWAWPDDGQDVRFEVEQPPQVHGDEANLILNVSGTIHANELPREVAALPTFVLRPDSAVPGTDTIATRASLDAFMSAVRGALSAIEARNKHVRRLHVFAALPLSAAVALGRAHDPHVHPELIIYDRTGGQYRRALQIP
jgi:hypothetical protein